MIKWLKKRGKYILNHKWDKVEQIEKEICDHLQDKDFLDKLQTPCTCVVTFENEEGYERANNYNYITKTEEEAHKFKKYEYFLNVKDGL